MIGTMYFYALAHQNDFDICWCKGSVAEKLFNPLVNAITDAGGDVRGSQIMTDIELNDQGDICAVLTKNPPTGASTRYEADAVVFAISIKGMQKLVAACPALAKLPEFRRVSNLKGIDVIATRLWFDKLVPTKFPSNVLSGFEDDVGGTFFNLNVLQDEYKGSEGSVIAADFYHSNPLMPRSDEDIVEFTRQCLVTCEPGFEDAKVIDSAVLKFSGAVTHFSPGSYASRPLQETSIPNLYLAGDWVKGVPHGANGLSQERAYVTGLLAANMVVDKLGIGQHAKILDVEADEPHIAALKDLNKGVKKQMDMLGLRSNLIK